MQSVDHESVGDHRMVRFVWRVIRPVARTRLSWTPIRGWPRGSSRPVPLAAGRGKIANHHLAAAEFQATQDYDGDLTALLRQADHAGVPTGWTVFSGLRGWRPQGRRGSSPLRHQFIFSGTLLKKARKESISLPARTRVALKIVTGDNELVTKTTCLQDRL